MAQGRRPVFRVWDDNAEICQLFHSQMLKAENSLPALFLPFRPSPKADAPPGVAGHNLLMIGPPGTGKSLLASCLPGILPDLSPAEALEVSMVQSVAGTLEEGRISRARPFRAPHHSASMAALTGGGDKSHGKRDSVSGTVRFSPVVTNRPMNNGSI